MRLLLDGCLHGYIINLNKAKFVFYFLFNKIEKMSLFKKKCEYCKKKIEKEQEVFRNVKVPGFIGAREKAFCCKEHADNYKKEVEEYLKKSKCRKSCCGQNGKKTML